MKATDEGRRIVLVQAGFGSNANGLPMPLSASSCNAVSLLCAPLVVDITWLVGVPPPLLSRTPFTYKRSYGATKSCDVGVCHSSPVRAIQAESNSIACDRADRRQYWP